MIKVNASFIHEFRKPKMSDSDITRVSETI